MVRGFLGLCLVGAALAAAEPRASDPALASLRPGHPRLYALKDDLPKLRKLRQSDPVVRAWHEILLANANKALHDPPLVHRLIGPRLLDQSRAALQRISLLAGMYRIEGDRRFADRAIQDMRTAAEFPDWNPSHFLDTAEMTNALAIGYDWLFDVMTPEDRATIRAAIVSKGLEKGLIVYRRNNGRGSGWATGHNNWNQVCNGGMLAGALAVADEEPAVAAEIVHSVRKSIPYSMKTYAPDGGCEEGPGYWNYAATYNVFLLAALKTALGTDWDLLAMPGFAETGRFRIHTNGPTNKTFNYADAGEKLGGSPCMLWMARAFKQPIYAVHERAISANSPSIFHALWSVDTPIAPVTPLPLDSFFRGVNVTTFRGAWDDPRATYVGFKGGDNRASHSHLDLGCFVLDALGQRWVTDLGTDNYNLPGYFGKQRWTYYRLNTHGQNSLVINDKDQEPAAAAPIVAFQSRPEKAFAVADLTAAYKPLGVQRALRGVSLLDRKDVLVQDEIHADSAQSVTWAIHTRAEVELQGAQATLKFGDARMHVRILEPGNLKFELADPNPPPPQAQQKGIRKLVINVPPTTDLRLNVLFSPGTPRSKVQSEPLETLVKQGAVKPAR